MTEMSEKTFERFIRKINFTDTCWLWTASTNRKGGYAQFRFNGNTLAHKISYEMFIGPVPEGLSLDHLCRIRICVNPEHMEPVTCRENILRGEGISAINFRKTHCIHGHEFTPENTHLIAGNGRQCISCRVSRAKPIVRAEEYPHDVPIRRTVHTPAPSNPFQPQIAILAGPLP